MTMPSPEPSNTRQAPANPVNLSLAGLVAEIADKITDPPAPASKTVDPTGIRVRQGVVTATASSPARVSVKLGGSSTAVTDIRYLSSYSPTVNDVVFILAFGPDLLVLGKLAP